MPESATSRRRRRAPAFEPLEGRALLSNAAAPTALAPAAGEVRIQERRAPAQPSARWSWLAGTYWYVPRANLPATIYDRSTGALVPVLDQTVYQVTGFRNGYFWGRTVTQLGDGAPISSALVGSVTPQGRVLLSFTGESGVVTQGYGTMVRKCGRWTMENQMFTGSDGVQVGHWAYMVQTRPGRPGWASLPSAGVSVPTFLGNYSGPSPTPAT